ncbi:MAG: hypothetical protein FWE90_13715 [Defluviitaleaceae bacterium]|nr:hypothetical protein [Defluviitaleaceae bacterium]
MAGIDSRQPTGIRKWWETFKAEYRFQRDTAARNNAARQFDVLDKAKEKTPEDKAKLNQLVGKVNRLNGEMENTSKSIQDLYGEKNADNVAKNNGKGRGLGALLGRIVSLRSLSSARASGSQAFGSFQEESIRDKPAPLESENTLRQFSNMAKERYTNDILFSKENHDKDFFPQFYTGGKYDKDKAVKDMHDEKTNGSKTLGRVNSRVSLAQMYMYSQGCTIDQIYGNTQDCQELRAKYGKELMEKLTGPIDETGKMYAVIAKKLNDFPIPEMDSDAALYNNMREIDFIKNSSINFTQDMGLRDENAVEKAPYSPLEQAFHKHISDKDFQKFEKMVQSGQSLHWNGLSDRLAYMISDEYSVSPDKKFDPDTELSKRTGVIHYANRVDTIKEQYKPGAKLSESKATLNESMEAMVTKSGELSSKSLENVVKMQTETITNGQVKQIKQQVLNAKPKIKTDDSSRKPYPKENLFEDNKNRNSVNNKRDSVIQSAKTNEQRKSKNFK